MANDCFYEMKVTGDPENIFLFISMMERSVVISELKRPPLKKDRHLYRITAADVKESRQEVRVTRAAHISGTCDWSAINCMTRTNPYTYYMQDATKKKRLGEVPTGTTLEDITRELKLDIEVYADEENIGFSERILITKGSVIVVETRDMYTASTTDYSTVQEFNETYNAHLTKKRFKQTDDVFVSAYPNRAFRI